MQELVWIAPLDLTGISSVARSYIKALDLYSNIKLRVVERFSTMQFRRPELMIDDFERFSRLKFTEVSTDCPTIQQMSPELFRPQALGRNIGLAIYETDGYHPARVHQCHKMHEIWVPTAFNEATFARGGVSIPIRKLNYLLDTDLYNPDTVPNYDEISAKADGRFIFLAVFSLQWRKGWDILLEAFCKAFTPEDPVVLVLKVFVGSNDGAHASYCQYAIQQTLKRVSGGKTYKNIFMVTRQMDDSQMRALFNTADAYVLPSRGEGWGMPYMEAMALGKPTIATRWSGQLEFMNDSNSFLIDTKGTRAITDEAMLRTEPYYQGQNMAEPSLEGTIAAMRFVFENKDEPAKRGAQAREDILAKFNLKKIAGDIVTLLEEQ